MSLLAHVSLAALALSAPARAALSASHVSVRVVDVVEIAREAPPVSPSAEASSETPPAEATRKAPEQGPRKLNRLPRKVEPAPSARAEAAPFAPETAPLVGLTLESTATAGAVAFATGQTLEGETAAIAHVPSARANPSAQGPSTAPPSRNRAARTRAGAFVHVVTARRLARVEPEYPPLLRAQGIEADVTVRVELAADGRVLRSELVTGSAEPAFDHAALLAAKRERFAPETHDGRPVSTSLTYTYRFRIRP